jgi:hypothetical protein
MRVFAWLTEERVTFEIRWISFLLVKCYSLSHSPFHDLDTCFVISKLLFLVNVPQRIIVIIRITINVTALDTALCVQLCLL